MTLEYKSMYRLKKEGLETVPTWPPIAGHYQWMNADDTRSAIVIWFGAPLDPDTGEELDRSPRWQALKDGSEIPIDDVWPMVRGREISPDEYTELRSDLP